MTGLPYAEEITMI